MKKSTKKIVNYLKRYIGHEIIRTSPTRGDWSLTDRPVLLLGFTPDGCIICQHVGFDQKLFGNKNRILPIHFTDRNWITYKKALRAANNPLNKWKGKKIKRICPTSPVYDCSYMCVSDFDGAPTLVSASKHHMVIIFNNIGISGMQTVLPPYFVRAEEWVLTE